MKPNDSLLRTAIALRDLRRIKSVTFTDLPQGQVDTLDVIAQLGPCTMVELSAGMRVDASTATRAVDRLVESELARRRRSDDDGRVVLVELTPDGRTLDRDLSHKRLDNLDEMMLSLSETEREMLADSLDKLVGAIDLWWMEHDAPETAAPPTAPTPG
jgi:DNA-binding MarR family transcriptional regulator